VRERNNEMVTATWNVLSLHQSGSLRNLKDELKAKKSTGRPRRRWLDNVENDLKKTSVRRWRKIAKDRYVWKLFLKEAKVPHGLYSQYSRKDINTILFQYDSSYCSFKMYVTYEQNILHMTHLVYKKFYPSCKNYCEDSANESDRHCLL
jgi:hypothetical protein